MSQEAIEKYFCKVGLCDSVKFLPQTSKRFEHEGKQIIIIDSRLRLIHQLKDLILLTRR